MHYPTLQKLFTTSDRNSKKLFITSCGGPGPGTFLRGEGPGNDFYYKKCLDMLQEEGTEVMCTVYYLSQSG